MIRSLTTSKKLSLIILFTCVFSLLMVSLFYVSGSWYSMRQALLQQVSVISKIVADRSTAAILYDDADLAGENLKALKNLVAIEEACISKGDDCFAHYPAAAQDDNGYIPQHLQAGGHQFHGDFLLYGQPIILDNNHIGTLYIRANLDEFEHRLQRQLLLACVVILLVGIIAFLASNRLQNIVFSPVRKLAATAAAVTEKTDYSLRAEVPEEQDEIGKLVQTFNTMLEQIEGSHSALQESEERFRTIFNAANDAIFIHDIETGVIVDVNQKMCEMFKVSRQEALRSNVGAFSSGISPYTQKEAVAWIQKCAAGFPQLFEWYSRDSSGRLFWVEVNMRRARIGAEDRIVVAVRDITERKLAEDEISRVSQEVKAINRIISICASTLNLEDLFDSILNESLQISGLEGGTICDVGPGQVLHLVAEHGVSAETIEDLTSHVIKVGDCLCGECARDHKPLILEDRAAVLHYSTREASRNEDIRFHAAFPLITAGRCLGVLCIFTRTDTKPSPGSMELLETVSPQIALAMENARLYKKSRQHSISLEEKVRERTIEIEGKNSELERFNKVMVGREIRMIELKDEIRDLRKQLGQDISGTTAENNNN